MSIIKNNKNYGTRVKIEEVQPNPFPEYLTVHYSVPTPQTDFKILDNTNNIAGYRVKGTTVWLAPTTTINVTTTPSLVLEFDLIDNTKIATRQFNMCFMVNKVELPASVTTLEEECFFNCRCMTELPNLQNITTIGSSVFYSTQIHVNKYVINDNLTRNINEHAFSNGFGASNYMYINGTVYHYMNGGFEGADINTIDLDFSNGIDGMPLTGFLARFDNKTINTLKFPSTLTQLSEDGTFSWCTFNQPAYFYCATPPSVNGGYQPFQGGSPEIIYIPHGSMSAYTSTSPWDILSSRYVEMPA